MKIEKHTLSQTVSWDIDISSSGHRESCRSDSIWVEFFLIELKQLYKQKQRNFETCIKEVK